MPQVSEFSWLLLGVKFIFIFFLLSPMMLVPFIYFSKVSNSFARPFSFFVHP